MAPLADTYTMGPPDVPTSPRSQSRLLLQTFALRVAVAAAYGHLGSLQGLSERASTAVPRMAALLLLPGAVILKFAYNALGAILLTGLRYVSGQSWEGEWALTVLLDLRLHVQEADEVTTYAAHNLDPSCVELRRTGVAKSYLDAGRGFVLAVLLAQSSASLFLVARRMERSPAAALVLDWSNGLYALIGVCTALNSLGILTVRGRTLQLRTGAEITHYNKSDWIDDAERRNVPTQPEGWKAAFSSTPLREAALVQSLIPRYFAGSPMDGVESQPVIWIVWTASIAVLTAYWTWKSAVGTGRRIRRCHRFCWFFNRPGAGVVLEAVVYLVGMLVATSAVLAFEVGLLAFGQAALDAEHVLFAAAHVREQVLIRSSSCVVEWAWNDPWSEILFVY